jgi:2-keto-4-pentenoate hydratase/2-oxohepta-3-ene-1,7-dioic acid hydratase in catechol pathway
MKLVTYQSKSEGWRAGLLREDKVVDIARALPGAPNSIRAILETGLDRLRTLGEPPANTVVPINEVRLGPPVMDPQKIVCVGQNYRDHCLEQNAPIPETPIIFTKFPTCLIGMGDNIVLPKISKQVDFEVELAFVIGKGGRNIPEQCALEHVAGYMILNDVTARDVQHGDKQWVRGKSMDTFAPCGPALVTRDEIPDPQNLALELSLNGVTMQSSNTNQMIFGVAYLISFLSRGFTWAVGDIVTTGTPPGVGCFRKPPIYLKAGDKVMARIERLGRIENTCIAE